MRTHPIPQIPFREALDRAVSAAILAQAREDEQALRMMVGLAGSISCPGWDLTLRHPAADPVVLTEGPC